LGRVPAVTDLVRVSEIFGPTIQGEGPLIGRPSVFVRTAGCDYRCAWCDTLYAVLPEYHDEWVLMTPTQIIARVMSACSRTPTTPLLGRRQRAIRRCQYPCKSETQRLWLGPAQPPPPSPCHKNFSSCLRAIARSPFVGLRSALVYISVIDDSVDCLSVMW